MTLSVTRESSSTPWSFLFTCLNTVSAYGQYTQPLFRLQSLQDPYLCKSVSPSSLIFTSSQQILVMSHLHAPVGGQDRKAFQNTCSGPQEIEQCVSYPGCSSPPCSEVGGNPVLQRRGDRAFPFSSQALGWQLTDMGRQSFVAY